MKSAQKLNKMHHRKRAKEDLSNVEVSQFVPLDNIKHTVTVQSNFTQSLVDCLGEPKAHQGFERQRIYSEVIQSPKKYTTILLSTDVEPFVPTNFSEHKTAESVVSTQERTFQDQLVQNQFDYENETSCQELLPKYNTELNYISKARTELCKNWLEDKCKFGDRCAFAHGQDQI